MRLLLSGFTTNTSFGEPFPIEIAGLDKPVMSHRIGDYINDEFWYYYRFYRSCRNCGLPWGGGWADYPPWVATLISVFNQIVEDDNKLLDYKFQAQIHGCKMG